MDKRKPLISQRTLQETRGYLKSKLTDHRVLSPEEEIQLAKKIHGNNPQEAEEAFKTLVSHNVKLVLKIAKEEFSWFNTDLEDLVSEGILGLATAAEKFLPDKNAKFSNYCVWWIRQRISRYILSNKFIVKIPINIIEKKRRLERVKLSLHQELGREATTEEILEHTGLSRKSLERIEKKSRVTFINIDEPQRVNDEERPSYRETLVDERAECPATTVQKTLEYTILKDQIEKLSQKEKDIILMRFGFGRDRPLTLEEVGKKFGVTRERIRQLEKKILEKLRKAIQKTSIQILCNKPYKERKQSECLIHHSTKGSFIQTSPLSSTQTFGKRVWKSFSPREKTPRAESFILSTRTEREKPTIHPIFPMLNSICPKQELYSLGRLKSCTISAALNFNNSPPGFGNRLPATQITTQQKKKCITTTHP